ncbi:MAG: hypothetical protein K2X29_03510, partial [Candidatus Obscuribacterales bacterium]|nr:hypothetical protein [Candidatus Obscuribacterales bacterium]
MPISTDIWLSKNSEDAVADTTSIEGAASGGEKTGKPTIGFGSQRTDERADGAASDNTGGQSTPTDAHAAQARAAFSKEATDTSTKGPPGSDAVKSDSPPAGGERSGLKPGAPDKPVQDIHTQAQSMAKPPESTTQSTAGIDAKQAPIAGSDKSLGVSNQSAKPPDATLISQSKPNATPPRTAPTESLYKPIENKQVEIKQQEIKQTERTQSENKQTDLPKTGSQSDSGKVQDTSAPHTADRPGLKAEPQRNEPIGQTGRQNIESHAPPAQTSKPLENPYQASKAGTEAKQETRAMTVPVPAETSRAQNNPVSSPKQNQSDASPAPERRDPVSRAPEARTPSSEQSRPVSTDTKPAAQAEQTRRSDEPRSQPTTGELGSGKSTKTDQIAHEQPITKEASDTGKHADNRSNPIIEASTVDAKQHAVDHAGGSKDPGNNSHPDEKSILVADKNKNQQSEPVKDVQPGENKGSKSVSSASEPNVSGISSSDGKQHSHGPALTPTETGIASDAGKQHSNDAGKTPSEGGNNHSSETGKSHSNETGTASDAGKQHLTDAGKASSESGNQHLNETGKPHSNEPGAATEGGRTGKMPSETASDHSNDAGKAPFGTGKPNANETGLAASDSGKHGDTHNNPIIEATTVEAKTQSSQ